MISAAIRDAVRRRANDGCEYCRLPQSAEPDARFHIEHIVARQHGGGDDAENPALACHRGNRHKGPNLSAIDPAIDPGSGRTTLLFHPRRDAWDAHFRIEHFNVAGLTATGRATVSLMQMNAPVRVELRRWIAR